MELLLHNYPRRIQKKMQMSLLTLDQLESFHLVNTKLQNL